LDIVKKNCLNNENTACNKYTTEAALQIAAASTNTITTLKG